MHNNTTSTMPSSVGEPCKSLRNALARLAAATQSGNGKASLRARLCCLPATQAFTARVSKTVINLVHPNMPAAKCIARSGASEARFDSASPLKKPTTVTSSGFHEANSNQNFHPDRCRCRVDAAFVDKILLMVSTARLPSWPKHECAINLSSDITDKATHFCSLESGLWLHHMDGWRRAYNCWASKHTVLLVHHDRVRVHAGRDSGAHGTLA